jgi:SpoVK/Ycf46/Vps4 family AAA+-type ATPase
VATAEQIKALIRSHFSNNVEQFYTVALQVAANEAMQGHGTLAQELRDVIEKARNTRQSTNSKLGNELNGLVYGEKSDTPKAALVMPHALIKRIERIIHEYNQQNKLKTKGLFNRRKIMLIGPPGTGKTMTARVLSHELHLPLYTIQVDKLVTKYMGETSAKLRQIFDLIRDEQGVYLFDEFDAIGGERSLDNDVGEMRRVLNSFLQFIEQDNSNSVIVTATNNPKLLDRALFRRFDDVLYYDLPTIDERKKLIGNILTVFMPDKFVWKSVVKDSDFLSHSEIDSACMDAIKQAVLFDKDKISVELLRDSLKERQKIRVNLEE